jgi:hypothetical protein
MKGVMGVVAVVVVVVVVLIVDDEDSASVYNMEFVYCCI